MIFERLMRIRALEGHKTGPAFGNKDGSVGSMADYDGVLHYFLKKIQVDLPAMISPTNDFGSIYSFNRTFHRTAEGHARAAILDSSVQNAMIRWRKIEDAKGKRPRFNMLEHYSGAKELMPVTFRYSYVCKK